MSTPGGPLRATPGGVRIDLRVIPRSKQTKSDGIRDGRLVLRVTAPPVDHAANDAVIQAVATLLDVPRRAVTLVSGELSRNKSVEISGIGVETARERLGVEPP